ncbi:MAG: tRNA pseudouridine(38-40) synthase TruA [Clostridia bacterium]|nr:tRNA pseudouridine(38-40) synthase TruA [Clostridia bacterium]
MKLLLKIAYDGAAYHGFQYQPNALSVQEVLTACVSKAFSVECTVTGCSRTDAGVHALGFCAAVEPKDEGLKGEKWCTVPPSKVHRLLNMHLPGDIAVTGAAVVDDSFHPRYSAHSKEYVYRICDSVYPDPFKRSRAYHIKRRLTDEQIKIMNEFGKILLGRHDFSGFMAQGSSVKDTVRTLYRLEVKRVSEFEVTLTVSGDGFLYNMVRIITGTLLDAAFGRITSEDVKNALEKCDRSRTGFTVPAEGLYLNRVEYGEITEFFAD